MSTNGIGDAQLSGGRMRLPRTRGAVSGVVLLVLGAWGALVPFIGPYFDFAFTPEPTTAWHWTAARGWYEVLPGAVAVVGGLILLASANRALTVFGGWLAVAAGGWFVVGPQIAPLLTLGGVGSPANGGQDERTVAALVYFSALGAAIVLFGALAVGRLSVHSVRDVRAAARRDAESSAAADEQRRVEAEQQREDDVRARNSASQDPAAGSDAVRGAQGDADGDATGLDRAGRTDATPDASTVPNGAHRSTATTASGDSPDGDPADSNSADSNAPDGDAPDGDAPDSNSVDGDAPAEHDPTGPAAEPRRPGYAAPQRYQRVPTSEQIPVEQIQRDHPTR